MTDDDALEMAIKIRSAKGDGEREQMEWKIKNDGRRSAAEFASYCCQCDSLHLKPWEEPPCEVDEDATEDSPARTLLGRMIAAGVSRFHPDPMAALAE
jgi:hypothetical protein